MIILITLLKYMFWRINSIQYILVGYIYFIHYHKFFAKHQLKYNFYIFSILQVKCTLTKHEMPCKEKVVLQHISAKKYKRLSKLAVKPFNFDDYSQWLMPCKEKIKKFNLYILCCCNLYTFFYYWYLILSSTLLFTNQKINCL